MPKIHGLEVHVADKGCTCLHGRTSPERSSEQLLTSRRLNKDATVSSLHRLERTMKRHLMTLHCAQRIQTSSQKKWTDKRTFELSIIDQCPHSLAELSIYMYTINLGWQRATGIRVCTRQRRAK